MLGHIQISDSTADRSDIDRDKQVSCVCGYLKLSLHAIVHQPNHIHVVTNGCRTVEGGACIQNNLGQHDDNGHFDR